MNQFVLKFAGRTMSESMVTPELRETLAPVLGRVPSGVFILIAGNSAGAQTGMLASWIQQASFEPPQVTVAVNRSRYLNEWLVTGSPVTLNQVAKGDNLLFRHFGKGFDPGVDAFSGVDTMTGQNGLPVLLAAMTSLEGNVTDRMETGDHVIYLVTLTHAHQHRNPGDLDPFVHIRKNGFSY
jgi:flavin reductase (DIM6/NTAB) family NADH-FMN oxidoreductase RutF